MKKSLITVVAAVLAVNVMAYSMPWADPHYKVKNHKKVLSQTASNGSVAEPVAFAPGASYQLCFVPSGINCEALLVKAINQTKKALLIQAYSFTSAPIAKAVAQAHERGVDVRVIVDKSQVSEKYTSATFLKNAGIPVVIDYKPAIAHNKIMIFDAQAVFTGSFNFTSSAANRNAENGMIVRGDINIVRAYEQNWKARFEVSKPY